MATSEYKDWMDRGRAHQREGRPIDAMLCYHRATRVDPKSSDPHFAIGEAQWQLGRFPAAIAAWREASRITRNHMAPLQAEAEALLAIGDTAGAVAAAKRVQSIVPEDGRTALICSIGAFENGDPVDPAPSAAIDALIAREPALLEIPALAGPLALALERAPAGPGRLTLLDRIAHSPEALANATLHLLVVALEHVANTASFDGEARARLAAVACTRNFAPADHDLLRRIACAVASFDATSGSILAKVYASLCTEVFAAPVPLLWPVRTAGSRWRVVVLVGAGAANHGSIDSSIAAILALPDADFDITVATVGAAPSPAIPGATNVGLPVGADATAARILSTRDPDVVVDLVGLRAMTGPLLAHRPARTILTAASIPAANVSPLVDRIVADLTGIVPILVATHAEHEFSTDCPLDAASLARQWDAAVRVHKSGDRAAAIDQYARMLVLEPRFAPALHLTGVALRDEGDLEGALARFSDALEIAPKYVDARIAAMRAATALGDHDRAIALGEEGRALAPGDPVVLRALGQAQLAHLNGAAAATEFAAALAIDPTDGETHFHHGVALQMADDVVEAARAYQRALLFRPDLVAAHFNLGVLFQKQGVHDGAATAFTEALKTDSGNVAAWKYRGEALIAGARADAFVTHFRQFAARHPTALPLAVQAIEACQYLADFNQLEAYIDGLRNDRFVATDEVELVDALEQLLYLLLYVDVEPELVYKLSQAYDMAARRVYGPPLPRSETRRPGPVRIGYLSGDLRNHVMGKTAWSAVEHHDRGRFELYFYSLSPVDDAWTARFRGIAHKFSELWSLRERAAAKEIAKDDLDILVDLSTHTKGAKPGILVAKPARVQITHVASSGTVGLSTIDFKLTDRYADVPENAETQIEALLPMDGCLYPYRHIDSAAEHPFHRASLGITGETIVIGTFVSALKLTRRCLSLWREVLDRIPTAKLAFSPINPALRALYLRLAAASGIAADRLLFLPQGRDDGENQARYSIVDFVLDPMPYGGVNGVLEPLDAGVPVVTLVGKRHGERTAYTILSNLGVTTTIALSGREYVEIAVRLATDPDFMRTVRERIRAGIAHSPLTDRVGHTRALERAYLQALAQCAPEVLTATGVAVGG